ncbi:MAG: hypothetical protein QW728_03515 [Thermoplasmata archaeon]
MEGILRETFFIKKVSRNNSSKNKPSPLTNQSCNTSIIRKITGIKLKLNWDVDNDEDDNDALSVCKLSQATVFIRPMLR